MSSLLNGVWKWPYQTLHYFHIRSISIKKKYEKSLRRITMVIKEQVQIQDITEGDARYLKRKIIQKGKFSLVCIKSPVLLKYAKKQDIFFIHSFLMANRLHWQNQSSTCTSFLYFRVYFQTDHLSESNSVLKNLEIGKATSATFFE